MRLPIKFQSVILGIFCIIIATGCGSGNSPVTPEMSVLGQVSAGTDGSRASEAVWGMYDIYIDSTNESVEIIPLRTAQFEANVTRFLHPPSAPVHLLNVNIMAGTNFSIGLAILRISIQHPFPGTNLRGFDVLGIFMPEKGDIQGAFDPDIWWPSSEQAQLMNADGFTRWWNMTEFTSYGTIFGYNEGALAIHGFDSTSVLNPYKYFANGLEPDAPFDIEHLNMTDRGSFDSTSPGILARDYKIQFPEKLTGGYNFRFKYAITSSYSRPEPGSTPPAVTEDFPLTANRAESVLFEIDEIDSAAYFESITTYGGDITFNLEIFDWQGMGNMQGAYGEIAGVYAESPTLFEGAVDLMLTGIIAYEPFNPSMILNGCHIPDLTPDAVDGQVLLITVVSANPSDYSVQIPGITGFDYPEGAQLAAFNIIEIPVSPFAPQQNLPPIADASASDPLSGPAPLMVTLDPSMSYDPDGNIFLFEWDIWNDSSFDITTTSPEPVLFEFEDSGFYEVQLRVTDNDEASDMLDEPLQIFVSPGEIDCEHGPTLLCSGDGNIFTDTYLDAGGAIDIEDNVQFFKNVINFDLGGPNSSNTIVKFYTGHGGNHNNSPITGALQDLVIGEGYTLIDTDEEPIDLTGCRIVFICLPGKLGQDSPYSPEEFASLIQFMAEGGRIVLTQEYTDSPAVQQFGNDFLDGIGSSIERLTTFTTNQLHTEPNECYAITNGVSATFTPAYTCFDMSLDDFCFVDDEDGRRVIVGDWL